MPTEMDEIDDMDTESSPVSEDVAADADLAEAAQAESSPATDETEPSTLSIVRDVVGEEHGESAAAASSAEGEEGSGDGADDQGKEPSDDYSDVPFNQHPRFKQLIRERNELRGDAGEYRKITSFMDANGLTPEEAANGVSIMALAKLNPTEAFKQVAPWFKQLAIAAGEILPDDLVKRVQANELTREAALEISRAKAALHAQDVRRQFDQQRGERQQQTAQGHALVEAADTWERDRQLKDPNFAAKLPRLQREIAFLHATEGKPRTPEAVKEQLKRAYETVNKDFQAAAPVPQQRKPAITPVRGGAVAGNARPETPSGSRKTVDIIADVLKKRA